MLWCGNHQICGANPCFCDVLVNLYITLILREMYGKAKISKHAKMTIVLIIFSLCICCRRIVGSSEQQVLHPNNIAVFEDYVYWTDWSHKSINRFNKFSGKNFTHVLGAVGKPFDMKILHTVLQPEGTY